MLEKLTLRNFQIHKKLVVEFDPAVTVIQGETNCGKSSIIRALQWVMLNGISGDAFINHDADAAKVILEADGETITRIRSKSNNSYRLNDQEYKSFGQAVPTPIADVLKVSDVNFQGQHDRPWWFSDSAGEVSRKINQIINLKSIDDTLSYLNSDLRKCRERIEITTERIQEATQAVEDLKSVSQIDADLKFVEKAQSAWVDAANDTILLSELIDQMSKHDQEAKNAANETADGLETIRLGREWVKAAQKHKELDSLIFSVEHYKNKMSQPVPDLSELTKAHTAWRQVVEKSKSLESLIFSLEHKEATTKNLECELTAITKKLTEATKTRKVCPTCKRIMN